LDFLKYYLETYISILSQDQSLIVTL